MDEVTFPRKTCARDYTNANEKAERASENCLLIFKNREWIWKGGETLENDKKYVGKFSKEMKSSLCKIERNRMEIYER